MVKLLNSISLKIWIWIFDVQIGKKNRRGCWIW